MPKNKEPIDLVIAKGKKHLTKLEIAERKKDELKIESKDIARPEFLPARFRKQFDELANRLKELNLLTDLDNDLLARYFIGREYYVKFTAKLRTELNRKVVDYELVKDLQLMQDKAFKQCRDCANDLGMSITSRAKLVVPKLPGDEDDDEL